MTTSTLPSFNPRAASCFIHLRLSPPPPPNRRHIFIHSTSKKLLPIKAALFPAAGGGALLLQDAAATAVVTGGAYALVSTFDYLTDRNIIQQKLSRKLVHILSGLLFMISWPIYSLAHQPRPVTLLL
ncbi:hypothetical protein Leryth_007496 [Lithospermum erythrorhizon]|nr:hypothetical protein Leryth_007496 [Lithospermum erythrorhizon]